MGYAAGVISYAQGLTLVQVRAQAMQELASELEVEAVSIRGLPVDALERCCKSVQKSGGGGTDAEVHVARRWCPDGVVCVGRPAQVAKLREMAEREGSQSVVEVRSLGNLAGNTPFAEGARARVAVALDKVLPAMKPPRCDLFLNKPGTRVPAGRSPQAFVQDLKAQLSAPIQWESTVTQMMVWGIREFYECGPNRSLRFMMGFFEHFIEAPLEVVRPAEFTHNVSV